jgi:undecaprenyl-diphosphatase
VTTLLKIVSTITDKMAGFVYVALAAIYLLLTGKAKASILFTGVGVTIGAVAVIGDFTLGELVDRVRPRASSEKISPAFPSGHVFAATVFFGFVRFLGIYYHLKTKFLLPMLVVFTAIVLLVGPYRVHVQAHFPSDVLAGYLLGGIWLPVIIPAFLFLKNSR